MSGKKANANAPVPEAPASVGALTSKEEWAEFVKSNAIPAPMLPTKEERMSWTAERKEAFDLRRMEHHADFGPIRVPTMQKAHDDLLPQSASNIHRPAGIPRRGGIIDGDAGVGKTTTLTHLGRKHERHMRGLHPSPTTSDGDEYIPVVYVTLPAATTIKGLSLELAAFYGMVLSERTTKDTVTREVKRHAKLCKTSMILVDDIHFLNPRRKPDQEVIDHLKNLSSTINATFVYAGIDCESMGLLNEDYSQLARRLSHYRVEPFSLATKEDQRAWASLLRTVENRLVLAEATDGMLYKNLSRYLFGRTGGYMGSLIELVREGATRAISSGEERITESVLDEVVLDYAAETESARRGASSSGSSASSSSAKKRGRSA